MAEHFPTWDKNLFRVGCWVFSPILSAVSLLLQVLLQLLSVSLVIIQQEKSSPHHTPHLHFPSGPEDSPPLPYLPSYDLKASAQPRDRHKEGGKTREGGKSCFPRAVAHYGDKRCMTSLRTFVHTCMVESD